MKRRTTNIILVVMLCVGLSLLLYPPIANWWNSYRQSKVVVGYAEAVTHVSNDRYQELLDSAHAYNEKIARMGGGGAYLTDEQWAEYEKQLDIDGSGVIGYIEIQKIRCTLPIYHGTDDSILQIAIGHIEGTSLPVGGPSTHCVLSGHRGLPSARLFTDIDQLTEGDTFIIRTLDEVLTYEVDQIRIVLPQETRDLRVVPGQDLCTLVTCTPYSINTHRLLVRGHRVETRPGILTVTAEGVLIKPVVVMPILSIPIILLLILLVIIFSGRKPPAVIMDDHRRKRERTMEDMILNKELALVIPDGFDPMTDEEKAQLSTPYGAPAWCVKDPDRHMILSITWKRSFFASKIVNARETAQNMEGKLRKLMENMGYERRQFIKEEIDGIESHGFGYRYDTASVRMAAQSMVLKKGSTFYYIHCYMRDEMLEQSQAVLDTFLKSIRWADK